MTNACHPEADGFIERDGVRVFWELYGHGAWTVLLLPTWSGVDSRFWKLQIPYLARHFRVLTFAGRGNGRSDRPVGAAAYSVDEFAADAVAVLDATATEQAALISLSCGALWATTIAAEHPTRVDRLAYISPAVGELAPNHPERDVYGFDERLDTDEGWAKYNSHYWLRDLGGFAEFFSGKCCNEPHSSKQREDFVGWLLETDPESLADATRGLALDGTTPLQDRLARVSCPTIVLHGDVDQVRPHAQGAALAQLTGGRLVTLEGSGHLPNLRSPVRVNLLLRQFLES